jgi:hypothetical protein
VKDADVVIQQPGHHEGQRQQRSQAIWRARRRPAVMAQLKQKLKAKREQWSWRRHAFRTPFTST